MCRFWDHLSLVWSYVPRLGLLVSEPRCLLTLSLLHCDYRKYWHNSFLYGLMAINSASSVCKASTLLTKAHHYPGKTNKLNYSYCDWEERRHFPLYILTPCLPGTWIHILCDHLKGSKMLRLNISKVSKKKMNKPGTRPENILASYYISALNSLLSFMFNTEMPLCGQKLFLTTGLISHASEKGLEVWERN